MSSWALVLAAALGLLACSGEVDLHGGLSERQANEAVLALREAGVRADKRGSGRPGERAFAVSAPRALETKALQVLRERGLPRVAAQDEVEPRGGALAFPLPEEQRATRARATAAGLAQTLEALPEVQEARIHLALADEDPFPAEPRGATAPRTTASVVLRLRAAADRESRSGSAVVDSRAVLSERVQRLVAHGVPGLRPEDVVVALAPPSPPGAGLPQVVRAGLLYVAPASRALAIALQALLLLLSAALVLALGALRAARRRPLQGMLPAAVRDIR